LLDVCQLKAVGGGKMDQDGNPIYDDWYPDGSDGMIPGFELVSPEEGTGPRPEPGSPGLSQVLDTLDPPNCTTWVRAGVSSEGGAYVDLGFECTRNGVGRP